MKPTTNRFPLTSRWGSLGDQEIWREELEKTGVEAVRLRVAQNVLASSANIAIGTQSSITKGFIEEWLTWHDRLKQEADEAHRQSVTRWTRAAAIGAVAAALFTLIGAVASVGQAVIAWQALPKP